MTNKELVTTLSMLIDDLYTIAYTIRRIREELTERVD